MKRNNLAAALVAVLLFGFGAVVGALAHRYYSPTVVVANSPENFRRNLISEMRSKLSLTPAQVGKLQTILDQTKVQMKAVRDKTHPEIVRIRQEQVSRVKEILTASQVSAYEKLLADRERRNREQETREMQNDQQRKNARPAGN